MRYALLGFVVGFFVTQCGVVKLFLEKQAVFEQHIGQQLNIQDSKIEGAVQMARDTFSAGQAGAMGPGAHAHDMTFQQGSGQSAEQINLPALVKELAILRRELMGKAQTAEECTAVGDVAAAETAAGKGDGESALQRLKSAGEWVLNMAVQKGLDVAAAAIKGSLAS